MADETLSRLVLPVEPYEVGGYRFSQVIRRRVILWATHLGDDVVAAAGTAVRAAGEGEVVMAKTLPGSEQHRSWGGLVVLRHNTFYSIYGHLKNLRVRVGERVQAGQVVGEIGDSFTPENGWWKTPHLHFAVYTGPWKGEVLPGYWRPERFWRTRLRWWKNPKAFIESSAA